ncbi:PREDICTED: 50S ribosomal protein L28, chloroplastic [Nelumbo nucifera]|uniref:Large ribosomal subunit protein bL28c n=2 Tax=Nelumbo nucifera TaxID=4432 RepID=A0A822YZF8_NELNU|nr:PREDICTED: 50S ribosomal protein L28, chloroplastic [Nelumbo nucifera]DAD36841.1 TPA_asm: hypothetical protein HUJ06_007482 [Nelumbo nucifera]
MAAAASAGVLLGHSCSSSSFLSFRKLESSNRSLKFKASDLGFLTSQLSGLKIANYPGFPSSTNHAKLISAPPRPFILQPVARRVCPFTGKKANKANKVSFSNHKTKKLQFVNLQYKRIWWEGGKRYLKLRLSTKALKTIEKNGLEAVAKKAGIDLRKE